MLLSATIVDGQTLVDGVHLTEGVRLDQETLTVEGTAADDAVLLWNNRVAVGSSNSADADYIRISRNGKLAIIAADLVSTVVVNGGDGNDRLAASADGFTQTADEDRTFWSQSLSVSAAISITAGVGDDIVYAAASDTAIDAGEGDDHVRGRAGNDTISGGAGIDRLHGGDGNDLFRAGDGDDVLTGDDGDDILRAT